MKCVIFHNLVVMCGCAEKRERERTKKATRTIYAHAIIEGFHLVSNFLSLAPVIQET